MNHLSLKQRAYNIIKEKLINLEFEPESRIREDQLAEEISMSRTPIREAMHQLEAEGLIKSIPRKGLFSIGLGVDEIKGMLDVRECLEELALKKCIAKITDEQIEIIGGLVKQFAVALAEEDFKKCNELDNAFHLAIAEVSENKKLIEFIIEISEFLAIVRNMEIKRNPKKRAINALKQHKVILKYIKGRDLDAASKELRNNINSMKQHLEIEIED